MTAELWLSKLGDWFVPVTESGCWIWTRAHNGLGYGRLWIGEKCVYAHRTSYELLRGPIAKGLTIDHLCRIPHCVNPEHLEPTTMRENILRGTAPSSVAARTNLCSKGHEISGHNAMIRKKDGKRRCRTCFNEWRRRRWEKP